MSGPIVKGRRVRWSGIVILLLALLAGCSPGPHRSGAAPRGPRIDWSAATGIGAVSDVAISADGAHIAACDETGRVVLFSIADGRRAAVTLRGTAPYRIVVPHTGNRLYIIGGAHGSVRATSSVDCLEWSGRVLWSRRAAGEAGGSFQGVCSADGAFLLALTTADSAASGYVERIDGNGRSQRLLTVRDGSKIEAVVGAEDTSRCLVVEFDPASDVQLAPTYRISALEGSSVAWRTSASGPMVCTLVGTDRVALGTDTGLSVRTWDSGEVLWSAAEDHVSSLQPGSGGSLIAAVYGASTDDASGAQVPFCSFEGFDRGGAVEWRRSFRGRYVAYESAHSAVGVFSALGTEPGVSSCTTSPGDAGRDVALADDVKRARIAWDGRYVVTLDGAGRVARYAVPW